MGNTTPLPDNAQIIGDAHVFAIEYKITKVRPYLMGHLRLWIAGEYVGSLQDENFLWIAAHQLERFVAKPPRRDAAKLSRMSGPQLHKFARTSKYGDDLLMDFGEGFDDFTMRGFKGDGGAYFVWKLRDDAFFEYPNYPTEWQKRVAPQDVLADVVARYREVLSDVVKE